jgi:hypothetical protein
VGEGSDGRHVVTRPGPVVDVGEHDHGCIFIDGGRYLVMLHEAQFVTSAQQLVATLRHVQIGRKYRCRAITRRSGRSRRAREQLEQVD